MPVTKEQIVAEAQKLGLTLSDAEVSAYVIIGRLPEKAAGSPPGGKDDDDDLDDGKDLTKNMRERLKKEKEKRTTVEGDLTTALAKLKAFEDATTESQRKESEKKGQYEKLLTEVTTQKTELETASKNLKENAKKLFISTSVNAALLTAGVPADRLPKAIRLFELDKVGFEWKDEKALVGEVDEEGLKELVEAFKKDNDFLFTEPEPEPGAGGFQPRKPPAQSPKEKDTEKAREELKKRHPRVFGG